MVSYTNIRSCNMGYIIEKNVIWWEPGGDRELCSGVNGRKLAGCWGVNRSCLGGVKDIPGREITVYANQRTGIWAVNVWDNFIPNG